MKGRDLVKQTKIRVIIAMLNELDEKQIDHILKIV